MIIEISAKDASIIIIEWRGTRYAYNQRRQSGCARNGKNVFL